MGGGGGGGGIGGFGGLVLIIRHCETARKEIPPKDEHANGATHLSRATTYRRQHLMNEQIDHIWKPSRSLSLSLALSLFLSLFLSFSLSLALSLSFPTQLLVPSIDPPRMRIALSLFRLSLLSDSLPLTRC